MQQVTQALEEVKGLFQKVVGQPAPYVEPHTYSAFPPGVDPVQHACAEVEEMKRLSEQIAFSPVPTAWIPPADCFLAEDAFVVRIEVPGIARDDLKVFVVGGECIVRGERKHPERTPTMRPVSLERPWGPFERRFMLPAGSTGDGLNARYQDGVLELRIAIEKEALPVEKKIDVK